MKKGEVKKMGATTLRNLLATLLVLVIAGSATIFYFGLQMIKEYSLDVAHSSVDASASGENIKQLGALKRELADGEVLVAKANKLFSTPDTYQTQALKDISKYASESGVTISSIDSSSAAPGSPIAGRDYSEVITLQSPVSYAKFLKFIDAIEGNLPKMQITGISISRPSSPSGDQIATEKITITVSTR